MKRKVSWLSLVRARGKERIRSPLSVRSQIDIMASILNEAVTEKAKTHVMYKCNLSFRQLQVYLGLLLDMGMLELVSKSRGNKSDLLKTSAKGRKFLQAYRKLEEIMGLEVPPL